MEELTMNEIECPVCLENMTHPIVLCISGHNVCGRCRSRMENCPLCKKHFFTRNRPLEQVATKICALRNNVPKTGSQKSIFDILEKFRTRNMISAEIGQIVLSELICHICGNYSVPPIFFCINGHSTCQNCEKCTKCSSMKTEGRNYALEKIAKGMECPCPFNTLGCSLILTLQQVNHIKVCEFREVTCPLSDIEPTKCIWFGTCEELKAHLTQSHVFCTVHEDSCLSLKFKYSSNTVIFTMGHIFVASVLFRNDRVYYRLCIASPQTDTEFKCSHKFTMNKQIVSTIVFQPSSKWVEVSGGIFRHWLNSEIILSLDICAA